MASKENKNNERRQKTRKVFEAKKLPFREDFPYPGGEKVLKDADARCKRAVASILITQLASSFYEGDRDSDNIEIINRYLDMFGVAKSLLPIEKKMLEGKVSREQLQKITWTYEAFWALVWSLGMVDDISDASKMCNFNEAINIVRECMDFDEFKSKCKPRSDEEILDMRDLYFCYSQLVDENQNEFESSSNSLNAEAVRERLRGLEWILNKEKDWFEL
ncbi:MAG: DUF4272 domain-containing protein [Treponema sp.]|nr:DUF4272 domain-containing protein [Treponema sp.]